MKTMERSSKQNFNMCQYDYVSVAIVVIDREIMSVHEILRPVRINGIVAKNVSKQTLDIVV